MTYDEATRTASFVFPGNKPFKLSNVTKEQADNFKRNHAGEFAKRGLMLTTPSVVLTREGTHG